MSDRGNRNWLAWPPAALLVAAPILALLGPVLVADRSLAMRDAAHFYHPLLQWTTEQWLTGDPPLWNPYENGGMPLLADASSALFYPGRLLLLAPGDFSRLYNLYVAAHVALAAFGSYLLARHWKASRPAAACAAIAYSCGGSVVFQHCNVVFLVGAAWLPFAAWAIDLLMMGRSWRAALSLGVVLALMALGGDPQMAYHVVLMGVLYAVSIAPSAEGEDKEARLSSRWASAGRNLCWLAGASVVGLALSAIQVLPSLEAAGDSDRAYFDRPRTIYEAAGAMATADAESASSYKEAAAGIFGQPLPTTHHERLYDFSLAPWRLIECVWPNVGGKMFPTHGRWLSLVPAEGRIWTPSLYFGLLPLLLALGGWRLRRTMPSQAWMSWLLILFTLGSFGWYGLGWLMREVCASLLSSDPGRVPIGSPVGGLYWLMVTVLPGYVSFRYPAKLLVVAAFAASQLAARGFDRAAAANGSRLLAVIKALSIVSALLLAFSWCCFTWLNRLGPASALGRRVGEFLTARSDPSLGPFDWPGCQRDVCLAFLQTAVVGIAAHWLLRRFADGRWQWTLVVLIAVDVVLANYWLVPTAPAETWRTEPAAAAAIRMDGADEFPRAYRASLTRWRPDEFRHTSDRRRMEQLAAWERDTLFPKYGLPHDISLVESYGSLKPIDYESLLLVAKQHGPLFGSSKIHELPHPTILRLLGTQYLIVPKQWPLNSPGKLPLAEPVLPAAGIPLPLGAALWRLTEPLPHAWIVHEVEVMPPLKAGRLADVDERTRDVLFPASPNRQERLPRDFRLRAVVETDLPVELPRHVEPAAGETCRVVRQSLNRVQMETTLTAPGLVVLGDRYAAGWTATVQTAGQVRSVPILRTNRVCRGVILPAGTHQLEMVYRPPRVVSGAWISFIGWLVAFVVAGIAARTGLRPWIRTTRRGRAAIV